MVYDTYQIQIRLVPLSYECHRKNPLVSRGHCDRTHPSVDLLDRPSFPSAQRFLARTCAGRTWSVDTGFHAAHSGWHRNLFYLPDLESFLSFLIPRFVKTRDFSYYILDTFYYILSSMRLHNFFISEKIGEKNSVTITDVGLLHQFKKVFRFNAGQEIVLFDNSGNEYVSEIVSLTADEARVSIKSVREHIFHPRRNVTLYQSIIKKDNFEWIVQKGTELGVSKIVPIISERSEKKSLNLDRLTIIAKEACEQSGRSILPALFEPVALTDVISSVNLPCLAFHSDGESFSAEAREVIPKDVSILIGPEGGWSDRELSLFREKGIEIFSLGSQTLRAETAVVAVATLLLL